MSRGENRVKNYLTNSRFDLDAAFGINPEEAPSARKVAKADAEESEKRENPLTTFIPSERPMQSDDAITVEHEKPEPPSGEDIAALAQSVLELAKTIQAKSHS